MANHDALKLPLVTLKFCCYAAVLAARGRPPGGGRCGWKHRAASWARDGKRDPVTHVLALHFAGITISRRHLIRTEEVEEEVALF